MKFSVPFNGRNGISTYKAVLKVYDLLGREITTLVNEEKAPGNYEVKFDGANLPSGVYFYRLTAGYYSEIKKMILLK
ncbi:MAG: T9SS type A sorting domain-containing protein [Bacteroidetes bacterium]|nr:T9SS type A sorting domain-containing protein [Bacteroidota bacterium]